MPEQRVSELWVVSKSEALIGSGNDRYQKKKRGLEVSCRFGRTRKLVPGADRPTWPFRQFTHIN